MKTTLIEKDLFHPIWNNAASRQKGSAKFQVTSYFQWQSKLAHATHQAEATLLFAVYDIPPLTTRLSPPCASSYFQLQKYSTTAGHTVQVNVSAEASTITSNLSRDKALHSFTLM